MLRKIYSLVWAFIFFFSWGYAVACSNDGECVKWADSHCACGVPGRCNGVTAQTTTGMCQCYGAEGHCHNSAEETTQSSTYVIPERVAPVRRATPVRRGAVNGNVDVDVDKSR